MRRLLAVLVLLSAVVVGGSPAPARADSGTTGFHWHDLTAHDGVVLKSNVIAPATAGRHPGIVFVASWGLNDFQYLVQAKQLAEHGYVVLSYTTRGFWFSGGKIDVGGPEDVADAASSGCRTAPASASSPARTTSASARSARCPAGPTWPRR
jgi:X-Pro dipeptidyl-peptidase (S15 family)